MGPVPPAVVAVVGPTAAGKSELALALAEAVGGEVVNADAMQLYRGMDIGTAKPSAADRARVPHHLLDVWDVTARASVQEYQRAAAAVLDDLAARGRPAVLVGGSGLYVRAVLDGLAFPGTDAALRARLEAELAEAGPGALHARLAERDPAAAAAILPSNGRRVVRALEVVEITGEPFRAALPAHRYAIPAVQVGLRVPRPDLDARIAARVHRMWAAGLVEEVRSLDAGGLRDGPTARRALGYAQVLRMLDGVLDEAAAVEEVARATRRLARRQQSWFGRDPRVRWLPYDAQDLTARASALAAAPVEPVAP